MGHTSDAATPPNSDDSCYATTLVRATAIEPAALLATGVTTGTLIGFDVDGVALIDLLTGADVCPKRARSCVELTRADSGKEVALVFEDGDRQRALIIGTVRGHMTRPVVADDAASVTFDSDHLMLTGSESVTLRCGAASITLQADGRITIRGVELESRASGLHRIQGGSVRIN